MTSTRATEETETGRKRGQRFRGRKVMLAYTMQVSSTVNLMLCMFKRRVLCGLLHRTDGICMQASGADQGKKGASQL